MDELQGLIIPAEDRVDVSALLKRLQADCGYTGKTVFDGGDPETSTKLALETLISDSRIPEPYRKLIWHYAKLYVRAVTELERLIGNYAAGIVFPPEFRNEEEIDVLLARSSEGYPWKSGYWIL